MRLHRLEQRSVSPSMRPVHGRLSAPMRWVYRATNQPSIFGFLAQLKDRKTAIQTALHEFGHTLGLVHEYQNPSAGEIFDPEATLDHYKGAPNYWQEEQIMRNLLRPFDSKQYPGTREYDPESIMNYSFPQELFSAG